MIECTRRACSFIILLILRAAPADLTLDAAQSLERCQGILSAFAFIWWVVGQFWTFGAESCASTNPGVYVYSVILIALTYALILSLILLFFFIACCLPLVLRMMSLVTVETRGLDRAVIDAIPRRVYDCRSMDFDSALCVICLEEYEEGDDLRFLSCRHHFHLKCIDQWLSTSVVCPMCKGEVRVSV
jgi:hypothetical protein